MEGAIQITLIESYGFSMKFILLTIWNCAAILMDSYGSAALAAQMSSEVVIRAGTKPSNLQRVRRLSKLRRVKLSFEAS